MALVNTVIRWDIKMSSYFMPLSCGESGGGSMMWPRSMAPCRALPTLESTQSSCHQLIPPCLHHSWLLQHVGSQRKLLATLREEACVLTLLIQWEGLEAYRAKRLWTVSV